MPFVAYEWVTLMPYWVSLIPFVWFISAGLAEVHGFKRTPTVFAGMTLIATAALIFAMFLKANGAF